jgi:hypothetical protein
MAIHLILGALGAGKGRYTMEIIYDELRDTDRVILTNFAVETLPWVTGRGKVQIGLINYLRYRKKSEDMVKAAETRIFRIPDDDIRQFFLYRAVALGDESGINGSVKYMPGIKYNIWQAEADYKGKGEDQKIVKFDNSLLGKHPMCYIVDEAWKFWPAREWDTTAKAFIYYASHSRKTGDELWMATHSSKDIDSSVVRKMQDFHLCVNRGKRKLLTFFRQPSDIKVRVYSHVPTGTPSDNMMSERTLQINPDGIAECYDTTGGVGLKGRMRGDMDEKKHGIPFKYLITGMVLLPITIFALLWWGLQVVQKKFGKVPSAHVQAAGNVQAVTNVEPFNVRVAQSFLELGRSQGSNYMGAPVAGYPGSSSVMVAAGVLPDTNVYCVGYIIVANKPLVMLSDGSVLDETEIKTIEKRRVVGVDGVVYPRRRTPLLRDVAPGVSVIPVRRVPSEYENERGLQP